MSRSRTAERALAFALSSACLLLAGEAHAGCDLESVVGVSFGGYDAFDASPLDSTGSITYRCDAGVSALLIDLSEGQAASYAPRAMAGDAASLVYNVYLNAARSSVWGDGFSGTDHYGPVTPPAGTSVSVPVYGRVPAGQSVPAGSYGDTLVVTLTF